MENLYCVQNILAKPLPKTHKCKCVDAMRTLLNSEMFQTIQHCPSCLSTKRNPIVHHQSADLTVFLAAPVRAFRLAVLREASVGFAFARVAGF
eukprot:3349792-Amphidinium_carterae.1